MEEVVLQDFFWGGKEGGGGLFYFLGSESRGFSKLLSFLPSPLNKQTAQANQY